MFARKRKIKTLYIIFIIVVLFFLTNRFLFPFLSFLNKSTSIIVYPVLVAQKYSVEVVGDFFERIKKVYELEVDFDEMEQKYHELLSEVIELRSLLNYYNDIEDVFNFKKRYRYKNGVIAQVLIKELSGQTDFFLIDMGSMHGIKEDMVAVNKNCLVGKIIEVYPLYSKVLLITDCNCRVAAYCSKTKASGIHVGTNKKDGTELQRVSHLLSVKNNDLVISSGEGLIFPQGFALGRIESVKEDGLYFKIKLKPLIKISEINYCVVIKKGI